MYRGGRFGFCVIGVSVLFFGGSGSALAGGLPAAADSVRLAPAPPCVTATVEPPGVVSQTVVVHNGCASPNRVKMIIAYGDDGDCLQYAPGQSIRNSFWVRTAGITGATRFDGLEAC